MKKLLLLITLITLQFGYSQNENYIEISTKLVESVKNNDGKAADYVDKIATANQETLLKQLVNDDAKKTFFINLYNSFVIYSLTNNRKLFEDRGAFFSAKQFTLAGEKVSLDNIEHDYLRHSSVKWGLGIFHKIFPSSLEKKYRVDNVDWRIHFSLNCGAKSCPPVTAYSLATIESQLQESSKLYLQNNASYDAKTNTLNVPVLMSWFRNDFGNKRGVRRICKEYGIIDADVKKPNVNYNSYDWTLDINNYR